MPASTGLVAGSELWWFLVNGKMLLVFFFINKERNDTIIYTFKPGRRMSLCSEVMKSGLSIAASGWRSGSSAAGLFCFPAGKIRKGFSAFSFSLLTSK